VCVCVFVCLSAYAYYKSPIYGCLLIFSVIDTGTFCGVDAWFELSVRVVLLQTSSEPETMN
jgi:hypothetical protein